MNYQDTTATPLPSLLTSSGQALFPYMNAGTSTSNPLTISNAWTYFASPASPLPTGTTVTPIVQATGNTTYSIGATCLFANTTPLAGDSTTRETMSLTFDNSQYLTHSITLSYGIANWLTRGLFVGSRHVYIDPQVDDNGIPDEIYPYAQSDAAGLWYDVRTGATTSTSPPGKCPLGSTNPATGLTGCEYRTTGADFTNIVTWQSRLNLTTPNASAVKLTLAYNGQGYSRTFGGQGFYPPSGFAVVADRAASGTSTLLGDLLNATFTKFNKYYKNLPIQSPYLSTIGTLANQRMVYNASNVAATLTPGKSIVVSASRSDGQSVVVPVTGVTFGTSTEVYGGQKISNLTLLPATAYTTQITPAPAWQ